MCGEHLTVPTKINPNPAFFCGGSGGLPFATSTRNRHAYQCPSPACPHVRTGPARPHVLRDHITVHAHPGCSATPPASSGPATRFSYLEIRPMALISFTMSEKVGRSFALPCQHCSTSAHIS
mmetsp:Transcript_12890/g.31317  ORF Transcript_12890/g.31317 Transcript_12890/m.31317 type:complete len:122 (+) Transcript_12890:451-816(+)